MAQHKSAEKQARQAIKHRKRNQNYSSMMKTAIKRVREATAKDVATPALLKAVKLIDQLAAKGLIHKNKAANQKSQLTKFVRTLQ